MHSVLVNYLGYLSLPGNSVVRLIDHLNMTILFILDVKQLNKQQQHFCLEYHTQHFVAAGCLTSNLLGTPHFSFGRTSNTKVIWRCRFQFSFAFGRKIYD